MTDLLKLTFDGGTVGAAASAANTAENGYQFTAMEGNGVFTANSHHGALAIQGPAAGTSNYAYKSVASKTLDFLTAFYVPAGIVAVSQFFRVTDAAGTTRYFHLDTTAGGLLRITDAANTVIYTGTVPLSVGWHVVRGRIDSGTTTSDGKVNIEHYEGWTRTNPVETYTNTAANMGAGVTYGRAYMHKYGTGAAAWIFDEPYLGDTYTLPPFHMPASGPIGKVLGGPISNGGGWTIQGSGVYIDEQVLTQGSGDTAFIRSAGTGTDEERTLWLAPVDAGALTLYVRARKAPGSTATTVRATVYEGAAVRHQEIITLGTDFQLYALDFDAAETAAVTDRSNLQVRLEGNAA